METLEIKDTSLIWGNLRNLVNFNSISIPGEISLVGTTPGEFPVDDFHPIYLEVSKNLKKIDISGRTNFFTSTRYNTVSWFKKRIISLPVYEIKADIDIECLKKIYQTWGQTLIPEDIPCLALAVKIAGRYSETREGQYVIVLLIWASHVARIFELDWFEGPLEDCITPEWYISASVLMNPLRALEKMKKLCSQTPLWQNLTFDLFSIPECLVKSLTGKREEISRKSWKYRCSYGNYKMLLMDLGSVLERIRKILM